jgi:pyruvate/2-oxoglutarate dehydrogenase complex dihydrolipoamide dehydrogenase (E3) component
MKHNFDLIVIGGGAAGLFAASVANTLGAKTCLIDKKRLGGDCTWFGCVPSKALLKSASAANILNKFKDFGLRIKDDLTVSTAGVMDHVRDIIQEISTHHPPEIFEKRGIKVIFGNLKFVGKKAIEINGKTLTAKKFIICTGSHPVVPPIEGLKDIDYLTNENVFDLKELPESLIVLGGGPIGVELTQSLNRLGVKVTIVEMMDRLIFREDSDASVILEEQLEKEGVTILSGKKAVKFQKKADKIQLSLEDSKGVKEEIFADKVLVAVGRAPNLEGLALEKAGVKYSKKSLKVNSYLQTSNKNIFACGDIVGPYMFTHVAAYQASVCVRNSLFKRIAWQKVNYANVAWATFTDPEVAHLGLSEEEAKDKYRDIKVYKSDYTGCDRAITDLDRDGLVKIITDKKGRIIGASIVGSQAGEIIQGLVVAKSLNQPLAKIASIMYIYPTLSELIKKTAAKSLIEKMDNPLVKFILKVMRKK